MTFASLSPDRSAILYARINDGTGAYHMLKRVSPFSADATTEFTEVNYYMQYSRDGSKVVWSRQPSLGAGSSSQEIWVADGDLSNASEISSNSVYDGRPSVSADNATVLFFSARTGGVQVFTMGLDGSSPQQLTSVGNNYSPEYSWDSSSIAFVSDRAGSLAIWTMNADGSNQTEVPNSSGLVDNIEPRFEWSPDGRFIVISHADTGGGFTKTWLLSVDGSVAPSLAWETDRAELIYDWLPSSD
jgi:Tol biopolymer transport system component